MGGLTNSPSSVAGLESVTTAMSPSIAWMARLSSNQLDMKPAAEPMMKVKASTSMTIIGLGRWFICIDFGIERLNKKDAIGSSERSPTMRGGKEARQ